MKFDIRFRSLQSSLALREFAQRRFVAHLKHVVRALRRVTIRVSDVNGPKCGADKTASITLEGRRIPLQRFEARHEDPYAAVDLALERASLAVSRAVARSRAMRRELSWRRRAWGSIDSPVA